MFLKKFMKLIGILILITLITLVSACNFGGIINLQSGNAFAKQTWSSSEESFTVPFSWYDGHIIIKLSINDRDDLRFALDSAASATVLFDTERTKGIALDIERTIQINQNKVNIVKAAILKLNHIEFTNLSLVHVPIKESPLFSNYQEAYFDGAIGYDIFSRYDVAIDFENETVSFYKDEKIDRIPEFWRKENIEIEGGIPYLSAALKNRNGKSTEFPFILDTGAPDYIYLNSTLIRDFDFPKNYFTSKTKNFDGVQSVNTSRLGMFKLMDIEFNNIAAHDLPYFKDEVGVGLIGVGLLRNFNLVFSYRQQTVAFKANSNFTKASFVDRSGLQLEPHTLGGVVKSVSKDSSANMMNINAGDIIVSLDNQTLNQDNFDELRQTLSSELERVNICWYSKGENKCDVLKLQNRF